MKLEQKQINSAIKSLPRDIIVNIKREIMKTQIMKTQIFLSLYS